jgi:aprataxin
VVIKDQYPKAFIHWLILPRDPALSKAHPLDALADPNVYAAFEPIVNRYLDKATEVIAARIRPAILRSEETTEERARKYVKAGVHASPSMHNLHIHIISKDMQSDCLRKSNHYLSFNTEFFVEFAEIPHVGQGDRRRNETSMGALIRTGHLVCCWCGEDYEKSFTKLKNHLVDENKKRFIDGP